VSEAAGAGTAASASDASEGEEVRRAAETLRTRERAVDEAREKLKQRIIDAAQAGESRSAIARAAGVSRQWVSRLLE
jgi:DNA invertase Pin-like site-specific DNA recombinase